MDVKRKEFDEARAKSAEGRVSLGGAVIGKAILFFALGALGYLGGTAHLPFGAAPFGAALLCSGRAATLPILAGLCLSAAMGGSPILYVGIWFAALCVRILGRVCLEGANFREFSPKSVESTSKISLVYGTVHHLFNERLALRMAAASLCSFGIALINALNGGLLYYDVIGMIISVAATPPLTYFFSKGLGDGKIFPPQGRKAVGEKADIMKCAGTVALCALAVFTLQGKSFYGIAASPLLAMGATLFFCRTRGMLFGGVAGLVLGLAYSPLLSPIFVLTAFCAGALFSISVPLGTWTGFAVGLAWGFYVKGIAALSGLFGALFASALLFGVADKLFIAPTLSGTADKAAKGEETGGAPSVAVLPQWALDSARLDCSKQKIKSLCCTLNSLSESFASMSEGRARGIAEGYYEICENAFDASCGGCPTRDICRGCVSVSNEAERLSRAYLKNRSVGIGDVGKELFSVCQRLPDIIDEINHNAAFFSSRDDDSDRSRIFSLDYGALADIIAEAQVEEEGEFFSDTALGEALSREIESLPLVRFPEGVAVWGKRRRRVTVRGNSDVLRQYRHELLGAMERALPFSIDKESLSAIDGDASELRASEAPKLCVSRAMRSESAKGEAEFCGDSVGSFFDGDGRFYACISDGMGSGRRAAEISGICVDFMEKMLSGGVAVSCRSARKVIEMLNLFLRNRNFGSISECSATLDLLEIDLINGNAFFCKCGAAPTYIFRSGSLFKMRSETLPLGILEEVDCKAIKFQVGAGDLIVMLSDGTMAGEEECPWLFELLSCSAESDRAEQIAERIVRRAKNKGSDDDISVAVIKIK